jgi:hypothetical protein
MWFFYSFYIFLYKNHDEPQQDTKKPIPSGSSRKYQIKYHCKLSRNTVSRRRCIHNVTDKIRSTGSLLNKKPPPKEKLRKMGARLEYTPQTMGSLAQDTGI